MKLSILIPPPAATSSTPSSHSRGVHSRTPIREDQTRPRDWADFAADQEWEMAVFGYLRKHSRESVPLWAVVNQMAAEVQPQHRRELRALKLEVLKAVGHLVRTRRVLRWH